MKIHNLVVGLVVLMVSSIANAETVNYGVANVVCYMPTTGSHWMSSNPCGASQRSFNAGNELEARFWDYAMKYVWKKVDRERTPAKTAGQQSSLLYAYYGNDRDQSPVNDVKYKLRISSKRTLVKLSYDFY